MLRQNVALYKLSGYDDVGEYTFWGMAIIQQDSKEAFAEKYGHWYYPLFAHDSTFR